MFSCLEEGWFRWEDLWVIVTVVIEVKEKGELDSGMDLTSGILPGKRIGRAGRRGEVFREKNTAFRWPFWGRGTVLFWHLRSFFQLSN